MPSPVTIRPLVVGFHAWPAPPEATAERAEEGAEGRGLQAASGAGQGRHKRVCVGCDGKHPALAAGALLEPTPVVDHLDRGLEAEQTREVMGGDFACAVADHGVRGDSELC